MYETVGEKTEAATPRRLEEAYKKGQFARSADLQTAGVLLAGLMALVFTGSEMWRLMAGAQISILGQLHQIPLTTTSLQGYWVNSVLLFTKCVGPVVLGTVLGGLLMGGLQNRFRTAPDALVPDWERLNPVSGLKRILSARALAPTALGLLKLTAIIALSYTEIRRVFNDPIFYTSVDVARIAEFLAKASLGIFLRIALILIVLAALDYAYQFWKTNQDLMMTRHEVKEELKYTEGNPLVKAAQRRRRQRSSPRQMLLEVHKADVVVTNPTHLAIALRYERKTMKAPKIVAKGARLNAQRIREIAARNQIPIIENKPLARLMFKYGKVGGEIPAQLYAAVAEVLAWVYRVNRYRYYAEQNQLS